MNEYKVFGICGAYAQLLMIWLWLWDLVDNVWIILSPLLFSLSIHILGSWFVILLVLSARLIRSINGR
jgi:hypothetical protein